MYLSLNRQEHSRATVRSVQRQGKKHFREGLGLIMKLFSGEMILPDNISSVCENNHHVPDSQVGASRSITTSVYRSTKLGPTKPLQVLPSFSRETYDENLLESRP